MEIPADRAITGADLAQPLDALFVNAPLRDYSLRPRTNDFTLPVLGMAYIATYAASQGFNVGVIDAEALGLGVDQTIGIINQASPRWAGFNLLAPTYEISARIAAGLDPGIQVMAGGHQAKAMPHEVLADPRFARLEALVLGEGETRVAELLKDRRYRSELPGVMWLDPVMKTPQTGDGAASTRHLAPDIDALPFVDRRFLADDPYQDQTDGMRPTWSAPAAARTTARSAAPPSAPTRTSRSVPATRRTSSPRWTSCTPAPA
jgi:anaerobic magnesium-protoporphyrin IX monomethyl ester cyclase